MRISGRLFLVAAALVACVPPAAVRREPDASLPPAVRTAPPVAVSSAPAASAAALRRLRPEDWPPIADELDSKSLAKAAQRSLAYLETLRGERRLLPIGDREVGPGLLADTVRALVEAVKESRTPEELTQRLKDGFDLYESVGSDGQGKVVYSSYYQPVLPASLKPTAKYKYPIYKKPADMVDADLGLFNSKWKGESVLGRVSRGKLVPYFDRRDIDVRGALKGKKLEIAWLSNQFDRLDLHIQGSGILQLPNGHKLLAKYAATNNLPYRSVGTAVVGSGAMSRSEITHEKLREYLTEHPEGESWLISQNPRYVFFDLIDLPEDGQPFGTISQPLTPGRSIAIDTRVAPMGAVAYLRVPMPQANRSGELLGIFPTSRFVMCQDTGGAIQGPGRVDIYLGHGPQAKASAVNQWHEGRLYFLLKKLPPRDR